MKFFVLVILFLVALITDGIIMPALFGTPGSFFVFVLLVAMLVAYGDTEEIILTGIILAAASELLLGLYFGTVIVAWLLAVWLWWLATRFFSLKPYAESSPASVGIHTCIGLVLLSVFMGAMALLERLFYNASVAFRPFIGVFSAPSGIISAVAAMIVFLILLRRLGRAAAPALLWPKNTA